jgi:hypothetical protein
MHGTIDVAGAEDDGYDEVKPTPQSTYPDGLDTVGQEDDGSGEELTALESQTGAAISYQLHVLVNEDSRVYIVDAAAYISRTRCQAVTTVTPTNGDTATTTS